MNVPPQQIRFDDDCLWVELSDGRIVGAPLVWFPEILQVTSAQRTRFELSPHGIHWDVLDEGIFVAGLLAGEADITHPHKAAA